jgi:hypothetical protein
MSQLTGGVIDSRRRPKPGTPDGDHAALLAVCCFSLFYFIDIGLRASAKYFWLDELCTVYLCRLPDLGLVHQAVLHGTDFNPPLFYILTRLANAAFGDGLVISRLPAIVGVWLLCVSLFAMVRRRSGWAPGVVAMLFPLLSQARFYAYEARPHGIVLGLAGLAALAWQRLREPYHRRLWLAVFGASLWASFLTHCYAIALLFPFGAAELYRAWRLRRLDRAVLAVMAAGAAVAVALYIPLLRAYRQHVGAGFFLPSIGSLQQFYISLLAPATLAVLACLVVSVLGQFFHKARYNELSPDAEWPDGEIALALGFLALPLAGFMLAVVLRGPFIPRYFESAILGVSLLGGYAARTRSPARWLPVSLAAAFSLLLLFNFGHMVGLQRTGQGELLIESSSKLVLATTPGKPLADHQLLLSATANDLPILVVYPMEFAFLENYAPPHIRARLYCSSPDPGETMGQLLRAVRDWCHIPYNLAYDADFLAAHQSFYVYGPLAQEYNNARTSQFLGAACRSIRMDSHHFLAEVVR